MLETLNLRQLRNNFGLAASDIISPTISARPTALSRPQVDSLRGLACLLLVMFHVIGYSPNQGLQIESGLTRAFSDSLGYMRMPLFTVLSGYVYALRPFRGNASGFMLGKCRRLLLPMLFVGTLFALVRELIFQESSQFNWLSLHIVPYAHFWFVEALFWIFTIVLVMETLNLLDTLARCAAILVAACLVTAVIDAPALLGLRGLGFLLPYFLLGLTVARFSLEASIRPKFAWGGLLVLIALAYAVNASVGVLYTHWLGRLIGICACLCFLGLRLNARALASIGLYSYAIFLLHVFFTAATRVGLNQLGVYSLWLHLTLGTAAGIAGPVVVEKLCSHWRPLRLAVLGRN